MHQGSAAGQLSEGHRDRTLLASDRALHHLEAACERIRGQLLGACTTEQGRGHGWVTVGDIRRAGPSAGDTCSRRLCTGCGSPCPFGQDRLPETVPSKSGIPVRRGENRRELGGLAGRTSGDRYEACPSTRRADAAPGRHPAGPGDPGRAQRCAAGATSPQAVQWLQSSAGNASVVSGAAAAAVATVVLLALLTAALVAGWGGVPGRWRTGQPRSARLALRSGSSCSPARAPWHGPGSRGAGDPRARRRPAQWRMAYASQGTDPPSM